MSVTLYYTPTSCGAASVCAATIGGILEAGKLEGATAAGVPFRCLEADIRAHKVVSTGEDFYAINWKGNVPTLVVKDAAGAVTLLLNEGAAVLQYVADHSPKQNIAPASGTDARHALQNQLNWLASELHKAIAPLFNPALDDAGKDKAKAAFTGKVEALFKHEAPSPFLGGATFTVADAYAYIIMSWAPYVGIDLSSHAAVVAYQKVVEAVPGWGEARGAMFAAAPKA